MNYTPPRPTDDGDNAATRFMQWVWDHITTSGKLIDVPGAITFDRTTKGIIPRLVRRPGGTTTNEEGNPVETFRLQSVSPGTASGGLVIVCKKLPNGEAGSVDAAFTYVARPFKLRPNNQRLMASVLWTYGYSADYTQRVASAANRPSENQVIVPYYIPPYGAATGRDEYAGDLIYAVKLKNPLFTVNVGTGSSPVYASVEYLDINVDGRAWARADET